MLRTGGRLVIMTPESDKPYSEYTAVRDDAWVALLKRQDVIQCQRTGSVEFVTMNGKSAIALPRDMLAALLDCLGCGAALAAHMQLYAVSFEACTPKDTTKLPAPGARVAFAFAHCAGCRDAAHAGALDASFALFTPRLPIRVPRAHKLTVHAAHEALCAAMHDRKFNSLRLHPYAQEFRAARHVLDHQALPMPQRRCAARECGTLFTHGMRYEISCTDVCFDNGGSLSVTALRCMGNARCDESIKRDMVVLLQTLGRRETTSAEVVVNPGEGDFKRPVSLRQCAECDAANAAFRCARCRSISYCSRACQMAHWPAHKRQCKHAAALAQASPPPSKAK